MKVLIIEDEAPAFRRLQKILEEVEPQAEIVEVIDGVEESVKWLSSNQAPDLIFMDIQLSDGISFEIFEKIKLTRPVIFTTAFDEYMLRAFKVNSIDYLLKPIKKEELKLSIEKYRELRSAYSSTYPDLDQLIKRISLHEKTFRSRFLVKIGDRLLSVEVENISHFYTRGGVVYLVTLEGKKYLLDQSMEEIIGDLDPKLFYRANRQYIIRFSCISGVHKYHKGKLLVEIKPNPEEKVVVSAEKAGEFRDWLNK